MATFIDDEGNKVKAVTAEQHALDNPRHTVHVIAGTRGSDGFTMLSTFCMEPACEWWNEEGYK